MIRLDDLIGKPFEDKAIGPNSYSCYGLAQEVHKRFGIILPDFDISAYACSQVYAEITKQQSLVDLWKPLAVKEVPCIVLIRRTTHLMHVGTYLGEGKFIHVREDIKVNIERISSPLWRNRIVGYYRYVK